MTNASIEDSATRHPLGSILSAVRDSLTAHLGRLRLRAAAAASRPQESAPPPTEWHSAMTDNSLRQWRHDIMRIETRRLL